MTNTNMHTHPLSLQARVFVCAAAVDVQTHTHALSLEEKVGVYALSLEEKMGVYACVCLLCVCVQHAACTCDDGILDI